MRLKRKASLPQILFFISSLFVGFFSQGKNTSGVFSAQFIVLPMWLAALLALHFGLIITVMSIVFLIRGRSFQIHTGYGTFGPIASLLVGFVAMILGFYVAYYFQLLDTLQGVVALLEFSITIVVSSFKLRKNPESGQ